MTQPDESLSLFHLLDPAVLADPYPLYAQLRESAPVHWDPYLHAWVVTRYADVVQVFQQFLAGRTPTPDKLTELGLGQLTPIARVMVRQMLFLDPPAHGRVRGIAAVAFTARRVAHLRERIQEVVDELIAAVAANGRMDVMADIANPMPSMVTAELLGVPLEDHEQLKDWSQTFAEMLGNFQHNPGRSARVLAAVEEMTAYFRSAVRKQASSPTEGLVHALATATVDGDRLDEEEVIANIIVTMVGGLETTTNLIGNGILTLLRQPAALEQLRSDPELVPSAVEELLRYESPSQHTARLAPADVMLGGQLIKRAAGGDRRHGRSQSRPRAVPGSRPARPRPHRQPTRRVRLGGAFLLRRATGTDGRPDRVRDAPATPSRPAARRPGWKRPVAAQSRPARGGRAAGHVHAGGSCGAGDRRREPASGMTAPQKPAAAARRALLEQRIQLAAQRAAQSTEAVAATEDPGAPEAAADTIRETPLAVAQRAVWWFAQLAPDAPVYNEVALITRRGPLDVAALQRALADVVVRHEAWRTSFAIRDGEPVQLIHPAVDVELPLLDLSHLPADEAEAAAVTRAAEHARRPYDLSKPPLLRPLLIKVSPEEHRLYLALHHLIFDGVSLYRVALPELMALYSEHTGGPKADLAAPTPYSDFVAWERTELARPAAARHVDFHRRRLAGAPMLDLPLDRPRPARPAYRGAIEAIGVKAPVVDRLRSIASGCSATLFQVLAAAYTVVLGRFSGQDDVVFGTATDLRRRRELYPVVGLCVSSSVLRVRVNEDRAFTDLVTQVRDDLADLIDHPVPFDELVRELQPERDPRMHPLFQAGFVFEPPSPITDPGWHLALMEVELGNAMQVAKFDLHLEFDERPSGELAGRLVFNTDLFDRESARRLTRAILQVLEQVVADPGRAVGELEVVPEAEQRRMLIDWNATSAATVDDSSLTALLEAQAARTPDAIAVRFAGAQVTYRELHESANALAQELVQAGAGVGTVVGLGSERSIELVVGLLAIVKAGAAYLPLDPALPPARLRYMVADAQMPVLLLDGSLAAAAGELAAHAVPTVPLAGCLRRRATHPPVTAAPSREDPAYVLYTSGSTGRPKAVVVPHAAVVNMLAAYRETPGFPAGSRFLALTTISFDIAAAEIWLPLICGERMVLGERADATDPRRLATLIRDEGVTCMQGTPSSYQMLLDAGWPDSPELTAVCGGEHLPEALAERLAGRCRLWNAYGPTETTVYVTAERVHDTGRITIGRPIRNTRAYILDRRDRPVPIGVIGELHLAGECVATGYLHRPELTAQRFVPEYGRPAGRMYRTGDLARYLPDGRIELFGRTDQQVKIRGQRVELGEIESTLLELSGATTVAVVVREDAPGDQRLVAYLALPGQEPGDPALAPVELRRRLQSALPAYMVPAAYVWLAALPQTASGKVDRLALPAPDAPAENLDAAADLTPFERRLVELWARVIGVQTVGPDDDFFALGGHSLLAVRLVAAIETELDIPMSVSTLIAGEVTVRGLASRLSPRGSGAVAAERNAAVGVEVVRYNSGAVGPALVLLLPSRESMLAMRLLHKGFPPDQPLIGLLAGLDDKARFPRAASIMQIAEAAAATIRGLRPDGAAYRIAGYSMAGLIAYEVAGMLVADGEEVEWLGLIDTYSPVEAAREFSIAVYLERSRDRSLRKSAASAAARIRTESIVRYSDLSAKLRRRPLDRFDELGARRLMREYTPSGHKAPLDLFVTAVSSEKAAPMLGWSDIHPGPVQIREIGGDHMSIMQGDAARRLADALVKAQPRGHLLTYCCHATRPVMGSGPADRRRGRSGPCAGRARQVPRECRSPQLIRLVRVRAAEFEPAGARDRSGALGPRLDLARRGGRVGGAVSAAAASAQQRR